MARIIFGRNPVLETFRAGVAIEKIYLAPMHASKVIREIRAYAKRNGIPIIEVDRRKLQELAGSTNTQGVVALLSEKIYSNVEDILEVAQRQKEPPLVAVLDGIEDPRNLGAIIRSAEGTGVHGVIIPKRRATGVTEVVAKASAGAVEHITIARVTNVVETLQQLKQSGLWIIGADQAGEKIFYETDLCGPIAIVIGSEGKGIRRLVREKCDLLVRIPMWGKITSLNASVAAALMFFEVRRQREIQKQEQL